MTQAVYQERLNHLQLKTSPKDRWERILEWAEGFAEKEPGETFTACCQALANPDLEDQRLDLWEMVREELESLTPKKALQDLKEKGFEELLLARGDQFKKFQELTLLVNPDG